MIFLLLKAYKVLKRVSRHIEIDSVYIYFTIFLWEYIRISIGINILIKIKKKNIVEIGIVYKVCIYNKFLAVVSIWYSFRNSLKHYYVFFCIPRRIQYIVWIKLTESINKHLIEYIHRFLSIICKLESIIICVILGK